TRAASCRALTNTDRPEPTPGVSTKAIWVGGDSRSYTAIRWVRVVPGREVAMASRWPTSRLSRVLLPTLGRPTIAQRPPRGGAASGRSDGASFIGASVAGPGVGAIRRSGEGGDEAAPR